MQLALRVLWCYLHFCSLQETSAEFEVVNVDGKTSDALTVRIRFFVTNDDKSFSKYHRNSPFCTFPKVFTFTKHLTCLDYQNAFGANSQRGFVVCDLFRLN